MTVFGNPLPLPELPPPPERLDVAGRARWVEAGGSLVRRRILATLDLTALEVHCMSFDMLTAVRREIEQRGIYLLDPTTGAHVLNPAVEVLRETRAEIRESARTLLLEDVERELGAFEGETAERTGTATTPREWSRSSVERFEQVPGELIWAYIYQVRALLALMRTVIEADRAEDPVLYVGMESAIELLAIAGDILELVDDRDDAATAAARKAA